MAAAMTPHRLERVDPSGLPFVETGLQAVHVDGGGPGPTQTELGKHFGKRHGKALRSDGHQVRDLAGQAPVPAGHVAVGHDGAAEALAEVEVDEVFH